MKKLMSGIVLAAGLLFSGLPHKAEAATNAGMSGNMQLVNGQIGQVTILQNTSLYKVGANKQMTFVRTLTKGRSYRVYSVSHFGGVTYYGVGAGCYVKASSLVTYETPPAILGPDVTKYISSRSDTVSVGVFDAYSGKTYTYNSSQIYKTASIVKMSMLADVLYHRIPLTNYEKSLLSRMIEHSDNNAASSIWQQLGSDQYVQSFFRTAGLTNTTAGKGGWWGYTTTNAFDQLTMMKYFAYPNKLLTDTQRAYGLNLMRNVELDQRWGTGYGLPSGVSIALKNGWSNASANNWRINSVGYVNGQGKNYVLVVLTINNRTESYGIETINTLSKMIWNEMPQHA